MEFPFSSERVNLSHWKSTLWLQYIFMNSRIMYSTSILEKEMKKLRKLWKIYAI